MVEAQPHRYFRQLVRVDRSLVGKPGTSLYVPKETDLEAIDISEDEDIDSKVKELSWSTIEITTSKYGVPIRITREAIEARAIDVVDRHIKGAARALAQKDDLRIRNVLLGLTSQTDTFTGDGSTKLFTLTKSPVLQIVSVKVDGSAVTGYSVDYYDGKIQLASAPSSGSSVEVQYNYTTRTNVFDAATKGQFSYTDAKNARSMLHAKKYNPNVMVIHPYELADLLGETKFIDASQYGDREPILNGEIGKFAGMKVLVTENMIDGVVLYINTDNAAVLAVKEDVYMYRKEIPERDAIGLYFYARDGCKVIWEDALGLSVNHASDAADL